MKKCHDNALNYDFSSKCFYLKYQLLHEENYQLNYRMTKEIFQYKYHELMFFCVKLRVQWMLQI